MLALIKVVHCEAVDILGDDEEGDHADVKPMLEEFIHYELGKVSIFQFGHKISISKRRNP